MGVSSCRGGDGSGPLQAYDTLGESNSLYTRKTGSTGQPMFNRFGRLEVVYIYIYVQQLVVGISEKPIAHSSLVTRGN